MKLPELPTKIQKKAYQNYRLQGINRSDEFDEGTLYDCKNVTTKRYPYVTTRKDRSKDALYQNATSITAWNELIVVCDNNLYRAGVEIGALKDIQDPYSRQFAVINTKLVIFPDKVYLDFPTNQIVDMVNEKTISSTITTTAPSTGATTQTMTISGGSSMDFSAYKEGDYVTISLTKTVSGSEVTDTKDYFFVSATNSSSNKVITLRVDPSNTFSNNTFTSGVMKVKIPDFDYICSSDNRVWGCVIKDQAIFASELGLPNRYYSLVEDAYASWAVSVATPGDFTGCTSLGSSVVFFKEYCIHKVLGSRPSDYSLYTYDIDGTKRGCSKSICVANDTIYYVSNRGVMEYTGGTAIKISQALGDTPLNNAIGGIDGERYYIYCRDGDRDSLFTYDLKRRLWLREEDKPITDFTRLNENIYMIMDGEVYTNTSQPIDDDWYIQFNDVYESSYNAKGYRNGTILGKKFYSKLVLRVEMSKSSYATVKVRCDGGRWIEAGNIVQRDGVFTHVVPIDRCDKFGIKIEGHGEFTLLAMSREFITESVRNE